MRGSYRSCTWPRGKMTAVVDVDSGRLLLFKISYFLFPLGRLTAIIRKINDLGILLFLNNSVPTNKDRFGVILCLFLLCQMNNSLIKRLLIKDVRPFAILEDKLTISVLCPFKLISNQLTLICNLLHMVLKRLSKAVHLMS
jgi:hypothetical protein